MELQRGVIGDLSAMTDLADAARERNVLTNCGDICTAARQARVPIIHARAEWRHDRRGTHLSSPIERHLATNPQQILSGTEAVAPIPELGDTSDDLVSIRSHGMSPWVGTNLDALVRSLQVTTIIPIGVSLNVGLLGLCINAVDLGYHVVLPVDATVGVPVDYGEAVIAHTLRALATLTTTAEVIAFLDQ